MTKPTNYNLFQIESAFNNIQRQMTIYQDIFPKYNASLNYINDHCSISKALKSIEINLPRLDYFHNTLCGYLSATNQMQSIFEENKKIYNKAFSLFLNKSVDNNIGLANVITELGSLNKPFDGLFSCAEQVRLMVEKNKIAFNIVSSKSIYTKIRCAILENYSETINSCLIKSLDNSKYWEILDFLQRNMHNRLEINDILEKAYNEELSIELDTKEISIPSDSKIIENLEYSFRKDSNITVKTEVEKLELDDIQEFGKRIIKKITKINEIHKLNTNEYFFDYTDETLFFAQYIISPTKNEEEYKELISQIFIAVYENSGVEANKIYEYLPGCKSLTFIKHYRAYYEHKYKKKDKNQYIEINNFIISTLDKSLPSNWHDWVKLQKAIYKKIDSMLSNILVELEKKFKEKNKNIATDN